MREIKFVKLLLLVAGWTALIYGLGAFLLRLEDGWVAGCGGVVHWTPRDPFGYKTGGWLMHKGNRYE